MRNKDILDTLTPIFKEIFDLYDISTSNVDPSIHLEEGWPIGTDVYIITGFFNSEMYIHRMYIVKEESDSIIYQKMVKLVEEIKDNIFNRDKFNIHKKDKYMPHSGFS